MEPLQVPGTMDAVKNKMGPSPSLEKFMVYGPRNHSVTAQQVLVPRPLTMVNSFSLKPLNSDLVFLN